MAVVVRLETDEQALWEEWLRHRLAFERGQGDIEACLKAFRAFRVRFVGRDHLEAETESYRAILQRIKSLARSEA